MDPSDRITADVMEAADHLVRVWDLARRTTDPQVSAVQLECLLALDQQGVMGINELADTLATVPSSASRLCDRLEASGLIERNPGKGDRRRTRLSLTRHGQRFLHQILSRRRGHLAAVVDQMPAAGRDALLHGLRDLQASIGDTRVTGEPGMANPCSR